MTHPDMRIEVGLWECVARNNPVGIKAGGF